MLLNSVEQFHILLLNINEFHENRSAESHSVFNGLNMLCLLSKRLYNFLSILLLCVTGDVYKHILSNCELD